MFIVLFKHKAASIKELSVAAFVIFDQLLVGMVFLTIHAVISLILSVAVNFHMIR